MNQKRSAINSWALLSRRGREKIAGMLLNRNANVNAVEKHYATALLVAAARGSQKIVEMLLHRNANVNAGNRVSALVLASAGGHEKVVKMLLDGNATVGIGVALERASAKGYAKVIEILSVARRNPDDDFEDKNCPDWPDEMWNDEMNECMHRWMTSIDEGRENLSTVCGLST